MKSTRRMLGAVFCITYGFCGIAVAVERPPLSKTARPDSFQKSWTAAVSGNPVITHLPDGTIRVQVRLGESVVWTYSRPASRVQILWRVSDPTQINAIPISVTVDGAHYFHLHANTYTAYDRLYAAPAFYRDRNYDDGNGDVPMISHTRADAEWHVFQMTVAKNRIVSRIDDAPSLTEPWPFDDAPWSWEIKVIGDHDTAAIVEFKDVQVSP